MSEIDNLLQADQVNAEQSKKLFDGFDSELSDAFDNAANLFECFMRSFGHEATDDEDLELISTVAKENGLTDQDVIAILRDEKRCGLKSESIAEIDRFRAIYYARRARALLLLQAYRGYMFAATDIRRLRVVSAIGQLRVEIEALALMYLFRSESKLAVEWYHIRTDQEGRKFYNKTKKHVLHFCQTHDLETEWNIASAAAQHARLGGLIDGLRFAQSTEAGRHVDQYSLALQDFDPNQPEAFIARGLYLLRTQAKLLLPMKKALSEVTDLLLLETRIPRYLQAIRRFYLTFERAYPEYVAQYGNQ